MAVKFGIIGLGRIAEQFGDALLKVNGAVLQAVASRSMERSKAFSEKFSAKKAYDTYMDLINDNEVDVIYIALTNNLHYEMTKLCLNNSKNVVCEKPFVLTKAEALELAAIAKGKNVLLMEAMWSRFLPAVQKAKEWADTGKIGEVKLIDASLCFKAKFDPLDRLFNPDLAGGSLYDVGVYPIEFIMGVLNEIPDKVTGSASFGKTGVDELVLMNMEFQSGVLASATCGFVSNVKRNAYIYGTEGYIEVIYFNIAKKCIRYDALHNVEEIFEYEFDNGFIFEINHIIELYNNNQTESAVMPLRDTIACAGIFDELKSQWGK